MKPQQFFATFLILTASMVGAEPSSLPAAPIGSTSAYVPKQSDRPQPLAGEESGFQPIFNGQTLEGWKGDPTYWRVENGILVGEVTPKTLLKSNTFIIWQGGKPGDFELKLDYRISPTGNSGVNYRSVVVPDTVTPSNAYAMRGYQCDIDGARRYVGNNYEEKGRLFLAVRGELTRVVGDRAPIILSEVGDNAELGNYVTDDWNEIHLIVRGNTLIHIVNKHVMAVVIDDDAPKRKIDGAIGMQVHVGPPMKVGFRNIRLKTF